MIPATPGQFIQLTDLDRAAQACTLKSRADRLLINGMLFQLGAQHHLNYHCSHVQLVTLQIMRKAISAVLSATILLAGCSTASQDVAPTYIASLRYEGYDCHLIAGEAQRLEESINQLSSRLDQAAANDKKIAIWGGILFWPALLALGGTKQEEAYLSQRKGEYDALQKVALVKRCPLSSGNLRPSHDAIWEPAQRFSEK